MSASRKGMTLLEVMVAAGITTIVAAMAMSVVTSGVRIARQGEQTVNSNQASRTAMEMLLRDLRLAGVPGGIWVASSGGTPYQINPIFTQPGTITGTDDLWMVVPKPNAMQANCTSPGSAAVVSVSAPHALTVSCTAIFQVTDTLLVSNFNSAALIDGLAFPSGTSITYAQQAVANFSSNPVKGGYQRGDLVMPVDIVRYTVRLNAAGRPELVRQIGAINPTMTAATPFIVNVGASEQRFPDIEDLQVAFGTGTEPNLTFVSGHNVSFVPAGAPLAVRISVVGVTPRIIYNDVGTALPLGPVTVEDHVPVGPLDGYRRSVYRRRVELLNMAAVNL